MSLRCLMNFGTVCKPAHLHYLLNFIRILLSQVGLARVMEWKEYRSSDEHGIDSHIDPVVSLINWWPAKDAAAGGKRCPLCICARTPAY